jgi:Obg family GTPase CgtA-like protein
MWQHYDAVERVQRQMEGMGLLEALRSAGVQPGDTVRIGTLELEWLW